MSVHYEVVLEATCCGRPRPLSRLVETPWSIGGVIWTSYRCADQPECEALELEQVRAAAEPFVQRVSN